MPVYEYTMFIRSLATRGHLGGLSRSTFDVVAVDYGDAPDLAPGTATGVSTFVTSPSRAGWSW